MLRTIAHTVSFLFHPLFVMTYIVVLMSFINPYIFGVHHASENVVFIMQLTVYTLILPGCATIMMRFLGFVDSLEMNDRKERIGPLIVTMICYLWISYNLYKTPQVPNAIIIFTLGSTIALCVGFFINLFSKISLHALGMGGLLGMIVITMLYFSYGHFSIGSITVSMNFLLMAVIVISGMVGTSRLLLEAHEPIDLYGGFFIGFGTQFLALTLLS